MPPPEAPPAARPKPERPLPAAPTYPDAQQRAPEERAPPRPPQVQPNEARTPPASEPATNIGQFPGRCRQPRSPRRRNAMVNDAEASPEVPVQGEPGRKGEGDVPGPMPNEVEPNNRQVSRSGPTRG